MAKEALNTIVKKESSNNNGTTVGLSGLFNILKGDQPKPDKANESDSKAPEPAKEESTESESAKPQLSALEQARAEAEAKAEAAAKAQAEAEAALKAVEEAAKAEEEATKAEEESSKADEVDKDLSTATAIFDRLLSDRQTYKKAALAFNAIQEKFAGSTPAAPAENAPAPAENAPAPVAPVASTAAPADAPRVAVDAAKKSTTEKEKNLKLPAVALGYFDLDGRVRSRKDWKKAGAPSDWDEEVVWKFGDTLSNIVVDKDIARDFYDGRTLDHQTDTVFAKKAQQALAIWTRKKK